MNYLQYSLAKIRLQVTSICARFAKFHLESTIKNTRGAQGTIHHRYEVFLSCCKQQEKAAVLLRRVASQNLCTPLLNVDLGIQHYMVKPALAKVSTRMDTELAITRHRYGDWGDVSSAQWLANNKALGQADGQVLSRYPLYGGGYFLVFTDLKRGRTHMRLECESA